jgi:hypothetical protein
MKKKSDKKSGAEMPELSFRGGVRGKYVHRLPEMNRTITLSADLAEVFPDSASANVALRKLASIIRSHELRGHEVRSVG